MATVYIVPRDPQRRPTLSMLREIFSGMEPRVGQSVMIGEGTFYALKIEADGGLDAEDFWLERHAEVSVQVKEIANLVDGVASDVPTADQIERVKEAFGATGVELYQVDV